MDDWITQRFEISQGSAGITEADGKGATWVGDIWDYKVGYGQQIVLKPTDKFGAYLVGDDTAEMPPSTQIRVVVRDVTNQVARPILRSLPYKRCQGFQDADKVVTLDPMNGEIVVNTDEHIVVMVNGIDVATTGDTDASASFFKLHTTRRKRPLNF